MARQPTAQRMWQQNVLRKFDLILHYPEGGDYDENGCSGCFSWLPCCKRPMYPAGYQLTGYLLLRPSRKTTIRGVSVIFGGLYETAWREGHIKWGSHRTFFTEEVQIVENRPINLEYKWYRFDFEYRLPHALPTSITENEGKLEYYAFGKVIRSGAPDIETFDAHFDVQGLVDIDALSCSYHHPVECRKVKLIPADQSELASLDENEALQTNEQDNVYAMLCLNTQAFLPGQSIIADVTVENRCPGALQCSVKFEQVLTFLASVGHESRGDCHPDQYHYRKNRLQSCRDVAAPTFIKVSPGTTETFSRMFDVPEIIHSTIPQRAPLPGPWQTQVAWQAAQNNPPNIQIKYFVKLTLHPLWEGDEWSIPVEVMIGNKDERTRLNQSVATSATGTGTGLSITEVDCGDHRDAFRDLGDSMGSRENTDADLECWDLPPTYGEAPPRYEEYFQDSHSV